MADKVLDARGWKRPLPILRAKKALAEIAVGGTLEILSNDEGAVEDFKLFCKTTGCKLVSADDTDGVQKILIRNSE